jgi:STAS domain
VTRKADPRKKAPSGLRAASRARVESAARAPARADSNATAASLPITLALETECTLVQAGALRAKLVGLLGHPGPVTIEAGATQRIDAAALELLAAFVRDRAASNRVVCWSEALPVIGVAARRIGLGEWLQLTSAQHA